MNDTPSEYKKAVQTALNILGFADNTEKKLREKLARKGHEPDAVDFAVDYVKRIRALDDVRFIEREARRLAEQKLYGPRRIAQELYAKGFSRADISALDLGALDFPALCARRIAATRSRYSDPRKLYAALLRYGFTSGHIRDAQALADEE